MLIQTLNKKTSASLDITGAINQDSSQLWSKDVVSWLCKDEKKYVHMVSLATDFYMASYLKLAMANQCSGEYGFDPLSRDKVFIVKDIKYLNWFMNLQATLNKTIAWQDSFMFTYLCSAVAGELRHSVKHIEDRKSLVKKLSDFGILSSEGQCDLERSSTQRRFLKTVNLDQLQNYLTVAVDCFGAKGWSSAFGGKKWKVIAETGLKRIENKISKIHFIDTVYDLKHNGGPMFDKNQAVRNDYLQAFLDFKYGVTTDLQWQKWLMYLTDGMYATLCQSVELGLFKDAKLPSKPYSNIHTTHNVSEPGSQSYYQKPKFGENLLPKPMPTCGDPECISCPPSKVEATPKPASPKKVDFNKIDFALPKTTPDKHKDDGKFVKNDVLKVIEI